MIYTDIISFFSSYSIGTPFALLTLQIIKTHISLKWRNNKESTSSCSLRGRRNLTSVSNVCEAVPRSLFYFRPPTDWTKYRKGVSNFLLIWLANRRWLFEQANHGAYSNPGTQVGGPQQGFRHCFADGRNQSFVSSVGQANRLRERDKCDIFPITVCVVPLRG